MKSRNGKSKSGPNTYNSLKKVHDSSLDVYQDVTYENSIVSITNQEGSIIKANERFCEISGYSREELEGSNHRIVNSGYHSKEFFKEMWDCLLRGEVWKGEICNRNKDGGIYWVETRIHPIWNESKQEYEFVSVRLEITHRKRYEEVLNSMQDMARIGYWEWNIVQDTLFWSSMIYDIHGLTPEEYTPEVASSIENFHPDFRELLGQKLEHAMTTGEGYDIELQVLHKDGHAVWTRAVGEVELANGKPFRVYGTFQDIDKRKRTRDELNRSQQQLNLTLESAGIGNWIYYPKEDRLIWDDASFEIFGVDKEKFKGVYQDWVDCLHPQDIEESSKTFLKCIENQSPVYDSRFRIIHPTKGVMYVKGRANIQYDDKGQPVEIIGLNWDITKEFQFERKLVEAREKAEEATRAKSAFLATMSHEIRTPMNGMMGTLELLSETKLSQEQQGLIETVQMCGDQLLTIVNDILDFSKIEAGKLELEYRSFDLKKLLKGIKSMFEVAVAKKGLELNLVIGETVPRVIKGDETRLKQVLTNLVSNALKFTQEGSLKIEAMYDEKRSSKSTATIIFKVVDTGMGIPLDKQGRLFQSFRQVDDTTTRKFGGSGLGLAICSSLVGSMGGNIGVESDEGAGSIFFFDIMVGVGGENELEASEENVFNLSFKPDLKILIAEDNPINRKLAQSFLKRLNIDDKQVHCAENGEVAWKMVLKANLENKPFDLVLMDMQMPIMDGVSATECIIRDLHNKAPVIFAMTANVFEEDKKRCFEAGMKDFISKPVKKNILFEKLCEYFPHKNSENSADQGQIMSSENSSNQKYCYINPEKILFEFEDDFDIFEELVEDYKGEVETFIAAIKVGLNDKNAEEIRVAGHTLKGIVSNFYCEKLRQAAFALEECGKNSDFDSVDEKLGVFLSLNELSLKDLDNFIKEKKSNSQAA